ncbi:hypothetical protein HHI36_006698 [Cryptolaemus montrouzieri]|uniref:Uncharacterized protein n=1 Tax=Cryptolaemus montrouzieri TaxID=559131 RepID=A0ABD2NY89_9CUCU
MSANNEEEKEFHKSVPLDLARNQITTVRTVEGKAPLVMSSQSLRGMRVLAQGIASSSSQSIAGPTIITSNIVPQAVLKQDSNRAQIASIINSSSSNPTGQSQGTTSITIQRPTQITLPSTPVVSQNLQSGATYHVPRGASVVANLSVPRGNLTSVRAPIIVTPAPGQVHSFVRPPRTPSPAQGTAWLNTNTSNGSQIKGAPTVLSPPVRGATVTGKPQLINRTQSSTQGVQTLRPATAILHSAIAIGQSGQVHSFKSNQATTGIQALNSAVTIAQVLPPRTQTIVYNPSSTNQFITASRLTGATTVQNQRQQLLRPNHVTSTRVTVPANQITSSRTITPQGAVLTPTARISTLSAQPTQTTASIGSTATRIVTTQPTVTINRLAVGANSAQVTNSNSLGQTRVFHSLVAVANSQGARTIQTSGAKVITQSAPGTIHLTPLNTTIKTTQSSTPSAPRTINVPASLVAQRPTAVVSTQAIPIVKAFSSENPQNSNVFIHAPVSSNVSHRATPSKYCVHLYPLIF